MSETAVSEIVRHGGIDGLADDWSADKQTYHVPWGKAMMWIFLVSDTFIFTCFLTRSEDGTRLNSSHVVISYAVFCLKKKNVGTGLT